MDPVPLSPEDLMRMAQQQSGPNPQVGAVPSRDELYVALMMAHDVIEIVQAPSLVTDATITSRAGTRPVTAHFKEAEAVEGLADFADGGPDTRVVIVQIDGCAPFQVPLAWLPPRPSVAVEVVRNHSVE